MPTQGQPQSSGKKVFISYTARDLTAHADSACDTAKAVGWVPVDHRNWAPNGRPSVVECLRQVAACDALVVISGANYGWVPQQDEGGDGRHSITHLEVMEARRRGIAVIPLLLEENVFTKGGLSNPSEHNQLDNFRAELKSTLVRFFSQDPSSVSIPVKLGLESWDGQKNDSQMQGRRALRKAIPLGSLAVCLWAWLSAGPPLWADWTMQPQPAYSTWLIQPATLFILSTGILAGIAWGIFAHQGRPQWMYRAFPLSRGGDLLLVLTAILGFALAFTAVRFHDNSDSIFEHLLETYTNTPPASRASMTMNEEIWHGARYEEEVAAFRTFIAPISEARAKLSSDLSLAEVRSLLSKVVPASKVADTRVQFLVDIAHFEEIAMLQDAGAALSFYEKEIAPRLLTVSPLMRAQAKYALASWIDYWAFTNRLEQINRIGAPAYNSKQVIQAWDDVLTEVPPTNQHPPRVRCATLVTRASTLSQLCGVSGESPCERLDSDMRAGLECARQIDDKKMAGTARKNLAIWLMANEKSVEAFALMRADFEETGDLQSGLQALGMQTFTPVVPAGQEIDTKVVRERATQEHDLKRRTEYAACLDLLEAANKPGWAPATRECRIAFSCFLTDNPVVNRAVCTVPEPKIIETKAPLELGANVHMHSGDAIHVGGAVTTSQPARNVINECDGDVADKPAITVYVQQPAHLVARVHSQGDSVLLVRGPHKALCADDSPLPSDYKNKNAGIHFDATPGRYEFFVGRWGEGKLDYELRIALGGN